MEKVTFTVTLAELRKQGACVSGYNKLVCSLSGQEYNSDRDIYIRFAHKEPINLLHILESNGADDCLWALRAVKHPDRDKIARYIACDCADSVLHIFEQERPDDTRPREAIAVARKFANGEATETERAAAGAAAWTAAGAAAGAAARDAARAAARDAARAAAGAAAWTAARDAARAAARDAARDAQSTIIKSYLA